MTTNAVWLGMLASSLAGVAAGIGPAQTTLPRLQAIGRAEVGRYERVEFRIEADAALLQAHELSRDPVYLSVTCPSGRTLVVPAFFHQAFEFRPAAETGRRHEWMYPTDQGEWRARFAPEETGRYQARAVVVQGTRLLQSTEVPFTGVARAGKGYVRVSKSDPRFFEFGDGSPCFPIGLNLAFVGESQYLNTERIETVFRKMATNGANFARVWTCCEDWAMGLEARKSAWGRSYGWNASITRLPASEGYHFDDLCVRLGGATNSESANVSPSHPVALKPGTMYQLAGSAMTDPDTGLAIELGRAPLGEAIRSDKRNQWTRFERTFTSASNQWWLGELALRTTGKGRVWLRTLTLREAGRGPNLLWEADPSRPARGVYNQLDSFMLDRVIEAAERHGIYLQLCLLTRDHYMNALKDPASVEYQRAIRDAQGLLRYAVARWGHSPHVFAWEYFNEMDPGAPTPRFHRELGQFLEATDPYQHLRTTSHWGPAPKHWVDPQLDIADLHWYLRPAWSPLWKDEVGAVLDRVKLLRDLATNKPTVLGEFGLANDAWGLSPYMKQDQDGVHIHNALWASALSGLSAPAFFWWWDTFDPMDAYPHFRPVAKFVADIPFPTAGLVPRTLTTGKQSRALALVGKAQAYVWICNPQATWWNTVVDKKSIAPILEDVLTLEGLEAGAYRVEWWDTQKGEVRERSSLPVASHRLELRIPAYASDLAVKLVKAAK